MLNNFKEIWLTELIETNIWSNTSKYDMQYSIFIINLKRKNAISLHNEEITQKPEW